MINKSIRFVIYLLFITQSSFAQQTVEMADKMRSNGKIYVVVAVCLVILMGLFLYLVQLDRKIKELEKNND